MARTGWNTLPPLNDEAIVMGQELLAMMIDGEITAKGLARIIRRQPVELRDEVIEEYTMEAIAVASYGHVKISDLMAFKDHLDDGPLSI